MTLEEREQLWEILREYGEAMAIGLFAREPEYAKRRFALSHDGAQDV